MGAVGRATEDIGRQNGKGLLELPVYVPIAEANAAVFTPVDWLSKVSVVTPVTVVDWAAGGETYTFKVP
jgi:hypothetical protein